MRIISYKDSMRMLINPSMISLKMNSKSKSLGPESDTLKVKKSVIVIQ